MSKKGKEIEDLVDVSNDIKETEIRKLKGISIIQILFFNSPFIYIAIENELHSLLKEKQQEVKTLTEKYTLLNSQLQEKEETISEQTAGTFVITSSH